MGSDALITIVTFLVVYGLIALEWLNKAIAALLGVMVLLILGVIDEHAAASFIDFETIMLLIGMMGIVAVLKKTGFFAMITVRIARLTGGQPLRIMILFCAVTAVISAFLDNVTTVLIMVPIIIELTRGMGLDPRIYVVALAMASNLGGTATLVGDPPNIIIGSKVGLTFNQFAGYLFMPVVLSTVGVMAYFWAANRREFQVHRQRSDQTLFRAAADRKNRVRFSDRQNRPPVSCSKASPAWGWPCCCSSPRRSPVCRRVWWR